MDNNIGDARREYADRNGKFTQEDAAAYFGVSLSTYKKWEQGQGMLNGTQLRAIASKYGVSVDYLLQRTESPSFEPVRVQSASLRTDEERELLSIFRSLSAYGRESLMVYARGCAASYPLNQGVGLGA